MTQQEEEELVKVIKANVDGLNKALVDAGEIGIMAEITALDITSVKSKARTWNLDVKIFKQI